MADDIDQVIEVEGLAKYLKLSKSTVYRLAQEGKLPGQKVGKHWQFRKESMDQWLDGSGGSPTEIAGLEGEAAEHVELENEEPEAAAQTAVESGSAEERSGTLELKAHLTAQQIVCLKERWIETPEQFIAIASTDNGRRNLANLFGVAPEALQALIDKIEAQLPASAVQALKSPAAEHGLGVSRQDAPKSGDK